MPGKGPNGALAAVMAEAHVSRKALARAVRLRSEARGAPVACDHTAVKRWLDGMIPREGTAHLIAECLSSKVGRPLQLADIGMASATPVDATIGTRYEDTPDAAAAAIARLWQADVDDVRAIVATPATASTWADVSLSWLVRPGSDALTERAGGRRVGLSDIEAISATASAFAQLDNRFGGRHARHTLVQFLRSDLAPLLNGRYSGPTGRRLYAVAAETTLLLAWMSYDSGSHGLAQRYFTLALRLAQAADDVLLAGSILDAMSHQATFLGRFREAANLARAARSGTQGRATATLTAHFHAMEARALAGLGDAAGAQRALSDGDRVFARRDPSVDPEWIAYFDEAELAAEFGHCYRDLGRAQEAVRYASEALSPNGASPRSDFFVLMVLAEGQLVAGDVEEACATTLKALELGGSLKSARCGQYVSRFRGKLERYQASDVVRELERQAVGVSPLWPAAPTQRAS